MTKRHFLTLADLHADECQHLITRGIELKSYAQRGEVYQPLTGKVLAMIFEKSSTRTRVSFEAGMALLGGHAIFMSSETSQLGRGEPVEDTARVLSRMVDAIMIRTFAHSTLTHFAENSSVPVINGLSDSYHPCQLLADLQTYYEHRGSIAGKTVAWLGDGNNMCHSYLNAAPLYGFHLRHACPDGYQPAQHVVDRAGAHASACSSARAAVAGADLVVTDVWASMGQEDEADDRRRVFMPYQVNAELMALAAADALFMHCLPAHRGEEVTAEVIDGAQSVVWEQAGNRLHAQKALLEFLLVG